jgi:hypothetical protein
LCPDDGQLFRNGYEKVGRHFGIYRASLWGEAAAFGELLYLNLRTRRASPTSSMAIFRLPLIWIIPA